LTVPVYLIVQALFDVILWRNHFRMAQRIVLTFSANLNIT